MEQRKGICHDWFPKFRVAKAALPLIPILVLLTPLWSLGEVHASKVNDSSLLLPLMNFLFLFLCPLAVAWGAAKVYVAHGRESLVMLGSGALSFACGNFPVDFVFSVQGANDVMTLHDCSALSAGVFHLLGASSAVTGASSGSAARREIFGIPTVYIVVAVIQAFLIFGVSNDLLPVFFSQEEGPTVFRRMVLWSAAASFAFAGLLVLQEYRKSGSAFFLWYFLGLWLIAGGLLCEISVGSMGSPMAWAGRITQFAAGLCLLIAVFQRKWISERGKVAARDENGHPTHVADVFQGSTRLMELERSLEESEERYRALFENSMDGILLTAPDGRIFSANRAACRMLGRTAEEICEIGLDGITDRPDHGSSSGSFEKALEGRFPGEPAYVRKDGTVFPIEVTSAVLTSSESEPKTITIFRDVTKRRQAESKILASERKFRALYEGSSDCVVLTDDNAVILDANAAALEISGYSIEELRGSKLADFVHPEDLKSAPIRFAPLLEGKRVQSERRIRSRNGSYLFLEITGRRVEENLVQFVYRDISERRRSEEKLRESEEKYRLLFTQVGDPIFIISPDTNDILDANKAAERTYGFTGDEFLKMKAVDIDIHVEAFGRSPQESSATELSFIPFSWHKKKDGAPLPVEISAGAYKWTDRTLLFVICKDISERRKSAELKRQADQFQAVTVLAAGVSHNFNNVLQVVQGSAELALDDLLAGDFKNGRSGLETILAMCRFGADTVKRLNRYVKAGVITRSEPATVFDLSEVVKSAIETTEPWRKVQATHKGREVRLIESLEQGCPVEGSKADLSEVVINLIKNAAEALGHGGVIEIGVRLQDDDVILVVKDNGIGISEENLGKIFTPFFTNKAEVGAGLGLAVARSAIEAHGGAITCESEASQGTTFTVTLPRARQGHQVTPRETLKRVSPVGIVVIDDMEPTVNLLTRRLEKQGHKVYGALSGSEGLSLFENLQPDLVICDLDMPGISGWEVGRRIKETCKHKGLRKTPFIVLTGLTGQTAETQKIAECGVDAVIEKPDDATRFMEVIARVLGRC